MYRRRSTLADGSALEGGYILILLTLSLVVVTGSIAFVVDTGALMLEAQRVQTSVDLASIGGTQRLKATKGSSASTDAENYASYVLQGNALVRSSREVTPERSLQALTSARSDYILTGASEGLAASYDLRKSNYFSALLGGSGQTQLERASTALYELDDRTTPLHVVLLFESTAANLLPADPDCMNAVREGGYGSIEELQELDTPECPSRLRRMKEFASALLDGLDMNDRVSLIDFSGIAQVRAEHVQANKNGKAQLRTMIDQLDVATQNVLRETGTKYSKTNSKWIWNVTEGRYEEVMLRGFVTAQPEEYELSSQPSSALVAAYRQLSEFEQTGTVATQLRPVVILLTSGMPEVLGIHLNNHDSYFYRADSHIPKDGVQLYLTDFYTEHFNELNAAVTSDLFTPGVRLCRSFETSGIGGGFDLDTTLGIYCGRAPYSHEEVYAGILSRRIQEDIRSDTRFYTVGVGTSVQPVTVFHNLGEERGLRGLPYLQVYRYKSEVFGAARTRDVLTSLADDTGEVRTAKYFSIQKLTGKRDLKAAGRFFEADRDPTFSFLPELLDHARFNNQERSTEVHLVSE